MKNDLFADALDYQDNRNKGGNSLFLWTILLLFLAGVAMAAWIASYYIFGQPERPESYEILQKLGKIEPPKKFAVTAAPTGEFLSAAKFYDRYSKIPRYDIDKINTTWIRDFIKNYEQTKGRICYLTGKYKVLKTQALDDSTLFLSGVAAYAESVDEPRVLIEYIYSAETSKNSQIQKVVHTGAEISLAKTYELCAVIHIQKLADNRLLATVLPLHYGTYSADGSALFTLEPPLALNLRAGWPVMRESLPERMLQTPTSIAEATPAPTASAAPTPAAIAVVPAATPVPVATPIPVATPYIASATPPQLPPSPIELTAPRAVPADPPPLAGNPVASGTPPRAIASATPLVMADGSNVPVLPAVPVTTSSTGGGSWTTFKPGEAPPGREMNVDNASDLADRGTGGERLYLDGSFVVTAANENRAIMRARALFGRKGAARVIADFPPGMPPPSEGSVVTRDSRRPFQIINVTRTSNGEVNIYVREIIE